MSSHNLTIMNYRRMVQTPTSSSILGFYSFNLLVHILLLLRLLLLAVIIQERERERERGPKEKPNTKLSSMNLIFQCSFDIVMQPLQNGLNVRPLYQLAHQSFIFLHLQKYIPVIVKKNRLESRWDCHYYEVLGEWMIYIYLLIVW